MPILLLRKIKIPLFALLVLFIQSCSTSKLQADFDTSKYNFTIIKPQTDYVFKTQIDVVGKHFSGITAIRKETGKSHIVFLNELGMKLFEFSFDNKTGDFSVKYIIDAIKKKSLIKTFENDFRLLLQTFPENADIQFYKNSNFIIKQIKYSSKTYYYLNISENKIKQINQKGFFGKKLKISISYTNNKLQSVLFKHSVSGLKFKLTSM